MPPNRFRPQKILVSIFVAGACWLALAQSERPEEQVDPMLGNQQAIAACQRLYNQDCAVCHGASAQGDRGPSLVSGRLQHGNADGEILLSIRNGVRGTEMPPFAQLSTDQIWQIIAFVRSLAGVTAPTRPAAGEKVAGDPAAGKAIFEGKGGCLNCHQVNGVGKSAGPDLSAAGRTPAQQLTAKIMNPNQLPGGGGRGRGRGGPLPPATITVKTKDGKEYRGTRKNVDSIFVSMVDTNGVYRTFDKATLADFRIENASLMPADFSQRLTGAEIQNVVAYLKTLDGSDPSKLATGAGVLTWERLRNSEKEPQNFMTYWGDLGGKHYSSLSQINTSNARTLQAKWVLPLPGNGKDRKSTRLNSS